MLALPLVFVSGSYKYGWTPTCFRHCRCLKSYCCRKNQFLQIHRLTLLSFGHVLSRVTANFS